MKKLLLIFLSNVKNRINKKDIELFISYYRRTNLLRITCIIEGIIPYCDFNRNEIKKELNYLKIIEENIQNEQFLQEIIEIYKLKQISMNDIVREAFLNKCKTSKILNNVYY